MVFSLMEPPCQKAFVCGLKRSFKLYRSACEAGLGYQFIDGAVSRRNRAGQPGSSCSGKSVEDDREQARAQQHNSGCGYDKKSIGDEVVIMHDAPAAFDDGPILLKISESAA
jgi:hypothetical protein